MCEVAQESPGKRLSPDATKMVPLQERLGKKIEDLRCEDEAHNTKLRDALVQISTHCFQYVDKKAVAKSLHSMRTGQKKTRPLHSCNAQCKTALRQYNSSRCIDTALRKFPTTD